MNRKSYALYRMVMLPITLGDPDHLKPFQFLHFALPNASSYLVIAKTSNVMYSLNVQVTAYRRQTVPDRDVVRSCDPLKFWGSNHIAGTANFFSNGDARGGSIRLLRFTLNIWPWADFSCRALDVCPKLLIIFEIRTILVLISQEPK